MFMIATESHFLRDARLRLERWKTVFDQKPADETKTQSLDNLDDLALFGLERSLRYLRHFAHGMFARGACHESGTLGSAYLRQILHAISKFGYAIQLDLLHRELS